VKEPFLEFLDLASEQLGASVVAANDEYFGEKERLISTRAPRWDEERYTDRGKWMDGWETRRRRDAGHDWCVIRLGSSGIVRGVDVDTAHFKGNYPESCAIDVCDDPNHACSAWGEIAWREVLPPTPLKGDAHNIFAVAEGPRSSHVRLRIFPDGGVARLRVYGEVVPDWARLRLRGQVDLAAAEHGGLVVACSDMFFDTVTPDHARARAHDGRRMGDAPARRRSRLDDHPAWRRRLRRTHRSGYPALQRQRARRVQPEGCVIPARHPAGEQVVWHEILPKTRLQPDARRMFEEELAQIPDVSYVRFNIFPDGGVARLRLYGRPA
jgi:allantoicase